MYELEIPVCRVILFGPFIHVLELCKLDPVLVLVLASQVCLRLLAAKQNSLLTLKGIRPKLFALTSCQKGFVNGKKTTAFDRLEGRSPPSPPMDPPLSYILVDAILLTI